jgi:hypothetical protein
MMNVTTRLTDLICCSLNPYDNFFIKLIQSARRKTFRVDEKKTSNVLVTNGIKPINMTPGTIKDWSWHAIQLSLR